MNVNRAFVALGVAAVLAAAGLVNTAPAIAATSLDGVVRTVAADTVEPNGNSLAFRGHSEDVYRQVLVVGSKTYLLKGKRATKINRHVRVTGDVVGNVINVTDIAPGNAVAGLSEVATTRVLAMLVDWTAPDGMTQTTAGNQLFSDTNGWYRDASYGALGQTGAVTPWMTIAGPTDTTQCYAQFPTIMSQAQTAAQNAGYVLSNYDNFIVYFPHCSGDSAGYAGWAYVGASDVWLNGYLDRRVTVHEQGHNYGLWHSHSNMCSSGGVSGTCSFSDYGDPYDAMGSSGYVGHFNGSQKTILGWMNGLSVDLSAGGSTTLVPMAADATATHIASVSVPGVNTKYWIEYRQPLDYDAALPSYATDGVLIHVSGTGSGSSDSGASLIDVRPLDGIDRNTSTLLSGQSWTSPEGITFAVGSVTSAGAAVTVSAVPQNQLTVAKAGTGTGTVTSSGPGINCGTSCSASYPSGTSVTLTAVPASGSTFSGWSGACSGTAACTVSITGAQAVTASFASSTTVTVYQQENATYTSTWSTSLCSCFSGGSVKYAATAGAGASFTFTGTKIGFVSERAPDRGSFKLYLDGVLKTTVSNYLATKQNAVVVWSKGFTTRGSHTIKIVVVGTAGHPRTDVDAFNVTS